MRYFVIHSFLADLDALTKKSKYGYNSVRADICEEFDVNETSEEIVQKSNAILRVIEYENTQFIIKTRIKNTAMKVGKSSGFRLISVVVQYGESTTFLTVYPKKGKFATDNISDELLQDLFEIYIEALENNALIEVDIDNELTIISNDE